MEHVSEECRCEGKYCPKCETVKCVSHFYISKQTGKLFSYCRECSRKRLTQWSIEHPERRRERQRRWLIEHPERRKEIVRRYNQSDHAKEAHKGLRHDGYYRKIDAMYYQSHREEKIQNTLQWKKEHPDQSRVLRSKYRARKRQAHGDFTLEEWTSLVERYNHTCLCCGQREPKIKLTADHVIPLSRGGSNDIGNIQPLCKSCNCKKHDKIIDFRPKTLDK